MRATSLLALLLLQWLLATCTSSVAGQSDGAARPEVGDLFLENIQVVKKKTLQVDYIPGLVMKLECNVTAGGQFLAWVKNSFVESVTPSFTKTLTSRNAYGRYMCVSTPKTADGRYKASEFLVTEAPKKFETKVASGRTVDMDCRKPSPIDKYKWYKFNAKKSAFEPMEDQTAMHYKLDVARLASSNEDDGYTFYKCEPEGTTDNWVFKVVREPRQDRLSGTPISVYTEKLRQLDTDISAIPLVVEPSSTVTFECRKMGSSVDAEWAFRANDTANDEDYINVTRGIDIDPHTDYSRLQLKNCSVMNKGYYRCKIGNTVRYAFLDIQVVVPIIQKYSKGIYVMGKQDQPDNELGCKVPIGGNPYDVVWKITPPGGAPFTVNSSGMARGFKSHVTFEQNQMVALNFLDNAEFNNYTVECSLGDQKDFVILRMEKPLKPIVNVEDKETYVEASCTHTGLTDMKFHENFRKDDAVGPPLEKMGNDDDPRRYSSFTDNKWYRCSGVNAEGVRLYSDPKPLYRNMPSIDIIVSGVTFKGRTAKVSGKPTDIICKVNNTNATFVTAETVKLEHNGTITSLKPVIRNGDEFVFSLAEPSAAISTGTYRCKVETDARKYKMVSGKIFMSWCSTDQFVCDGKCHNKSIKCDKKNDCEDGSDELPSMCNPCEPNEVPCGVWKGASPSRTCVLKHWLCDGTDDCGNRYDEDSTVGKEWCQPSCVDKPGLNCLANETCCVNENKCILRAYECDNENDCDGGTDEGKEKCCTLKIEEPSRDVTQNATSGSKVTLTCRANGFERPTINWRCNWGPLRDPDRMKETMVVQRRTNDGFYEVVGTLTINNFTNADSCIYNCEAVTKCKSEISPEINIKVL